MGTAYAIFNLDRKEKIKPHAFGDGYKLCEFASSPNGTMEALAFLLGPDTESRDNVAGLWSGNRITIESEHGMLYDDESYEDISSRVHCAMRESGSRVRASVRSEDQGTPMSLPPAED